MGNGHGATRQYSPHLMQIPLHIECKQNPELNADTVLSFMYCRSNRIYDLFRKVTETISNLHNIQNFELAEVKPTSFFEIHIQKINQKDWIQSQYQSIAEYSRKHIERKGLHILISIVDNNEKDLAKLNPSSLRKPLQDITNNNKDYDHQENKSPAQKKQNVTSKLDEKIKKLTKYNIAFENYHDIMTRYFKEETELFTQMEGDYIKSGQHIVTWNHRSILIDWLIEVQSEYEFSNKTLFTAIHYIDRYLSSKRINNRKDILILGTAALLISSKALDVMPINMQDAICIAENLYSTQQILKMEMDILTVIGWNVFQITPFCFLYCWLQILAVYNKGNNKDNKFVHCAEFIIHCISMYKQYTNITISRLVASAIYLTSIYLSTEYKIDVHLLIHISRYNDLLTNTQQLHDIHNMIKQAIEIKENPSFSSIHTKYSSKQYSRIVQHFELKSTLNKFQHAFPLKSTV